MATSKVLSEAVGVGFISGNSTGTILGNTVNFADSTQIGTASSLGMRNRVINGDMRIDQRNAGSAFNITSAYNYCVDRWNVTTSSAASGTLTAQRIATSAPGGAQYCLRLSRTSGTFTGYFILGQVIETINCYDMAGKTVTLSYKARKGSGYTGSYLQPYLNTGTGTDEGISLAYGQAWTGNIITGGIQSVLTTSFQTFTSTFNLPSNVTEIAIIFATGAFSGSGSSTDYIDITDVQLEVGSVATPFERRAIGTELALCQRYYLTGSTGAMPRPGDFLMFGYTYLPVTMRANPTTTNQGGFSVAYAVPSYIEFRLQGVSGGGTTFNWTASAEL